MPSDFSSRSLTADSRRRFLEEIVGRCAASATARGVVVFDLDGTLMDNRPRVAAILQELAHHWSETHSEAAAACRSLDIDTMSYGIVDNLRALGIDDDALIEEGAAFWAERFFTDEYLRHDVEVPGAAAFARRCHEAGANLVYLTGRDLPNMALGSFASLRDLGFPIGVIGTELVTKQDFGTPDDAFKRGVADQLARLGDVAAVFDNEPVNCNLLLAAHPRTRSVLLDTLHAPKPPELHPDVVVIDTFQM